MTRQQKHLVQYWAFGTTIVLAAILTSFLDIEYQQAAVVVMSALFGIVSLFQDFSWYRGYGHGGKWLGQFVALHPGLRNWLVVYCAFVLPFLIYKMLTDEGVSGLLYFLSFLLLIGPVVYVSEAERFRSLGNEET